MHRTYIMHFNIYFLLRIILLLLLCMEYFRNLIARERDIFCVALIVNINVSEKITAQADTTPTAIIKYKFAPSQTIKETTDITAAVTESTALKNIRLLTIPLLSTISPISPYISISDSLSLIAFFRLLILLTFILSPIDIIT